MGTASWILAAFFVWFVGRYAYRAGISVAIADSWNFIEGFVTHLNHGTLSLDDFFGKRPLSYDHSQPIQRAVLWLHMVLFQMDFGVEGVIGCIFAAGLAAFCVYVANEPFQKAAQKPWFSALLLVSIFAAVFTLNARNVFDWSLVTLVFADILGAVLLIAYADRCRQKGHPLRLLIAVFIGCALMDTVGIMAVAAISLLYLLSYARHGGARSHWILIGSSLSGALLYKVLYTLIFLGGNPGGGGLIAKLPNLLNGWRESWKVIVVPLGGAIVSPSRILAFKPAYLWPSLWLSAAVMLLISVWFWKRFLKHTDERIPFIAAGLMLICYGSVAGVLLVRVPEFGFDYLLQPRYALFFTLQLVAVLMMASHAWSRGASKTARGLITFGALCVVGLWIVYAKATAIEQPYVRAYNQQMADQIHALWLNPEATPTPCSVNIVPCSWTPQKRKDVIGELAKGPWNVFSPSFRHRHGLRWIEDNPTK